MDIAFIVAVACVIIAFAIFVIRDVVKVKKMSKEEKEALIASFISGAVVLAEKELGKGRGEEKLAMVEKYFYDKAPILYKIVLKRIGAENLKGIIEKALEEIKTNFGGK